MLATLKRKARRSLQRLRTPISADRLRSALDQLTGSGTDVLFVHSSLSNCGRFTAGASDVLRALDECCGTLAFPTHTYCYPGTPNELGPIFDRSLTPSQNGLLTEMFRALPHVSRSLQATHSL